MASLHIYMYTNPGQPKIKPLATKLPDWCSIVWPQRFFLPTNKQQWATHYATLCSICITSHKLWDLSTVPTIIAALSHFVNHIRIWHTNLNHHHVKPNLIYKIILNSSIFSAPVFELLISSQQPSWLCFTKSLIHLLKSQLSPSRLNNSQKNFNQPNKS
jgi:hypothetical protein